MSTTEMPRIPILPYSLIVGQEKGLKLALELSYIARGIGGVLLSGQRGTAKSTIVRAFAQMMYGEQKLPVTLPINATEDRVVGGWKIDDLIAGKAEPMPGLLQEADGTILYIDEVNLLDDHIVNIILDVTSTGVLVIQRDSQGEQKPVSFTLIGTMNPEEGTLRPQLLDRFGLMVDVKAEDDPAMRQQILRTVLRFDEALPALRSGATVPFIDKARKQGKERAAYLQYARDQLLRKVQVPDAVVAMCIALAQAFKAEGHRGDYVLALAAQACAARAGKAEVSVGHVRQVARLALQHRRQGDLQMRWDEQDDQKVADVLHG